MGLIVREAEWQKQVIATARLYGWKAVHFRAAMTKKGWRTAVQADGAGFPDLVLVRERILFVEVKADGGRLSENQKEWAACILAAGSRYYCWRPRDFPEVVRILSGGQAEGR